MHACMHACMHTHTFTHMHTCIHVCMHAYMHTYTQACMYASAGPRVFFVGLFSFSVGSRSFVYPPGPCHSLCFCGADSVTRNLPVFSGGRVRHLFSRQSIQLYNNCTKRVRQLYGSDTYRIYTCIYIMHQYGQARIYNMYIYILYTHRHAYMPTCVYT